MPGTEDRSVRKVLALARQRLGNAGVETAALDGRVLLARAMNCPRAWLYKKFAKQWESALRRADGRDKFKKRRVD